LVAAEDAELDLTGIAIRVACDEYSGLEPQVLLARLAALGDGALRALSGAEHAEDAALRALAHHLFEVEGFAGNQDDYYDPRNSYINDVLERKVGIPITLSLVYMEVGKRIGLRIEPISFPSHFLVRVAVGDDWRIVDPFSAGAPCEPAELLARLQRALGNARLAKAYLPRALSSSPRREMAMRMLRNLKGIYVAQEDWVRALRVTDRMVVLDPSAVSELRDRGYLYARIEHFPAAVADYERYLALAPNAQDASAVAAQVAALRAHGARLN
jgi:regulator of sirC expression with transglutaminase-like and TPR domain